MRLEKLGEFNLIDRISRKIKLSNRVIKGIGDDAAVLKYNKDSYLLFTCDMLLEGRHFYRRSGGYLVGKKSLSASISDIAAMGGVPKFAVISLGVPGSLNIKYVDNLYKGIKGVAKKFKVDLVGGDTICSQKIVIDIALLGEVEKKNLVLRSRAKEGDAIFVTGEIGGSLKGKHLNFIPRLKEARFLVKNFKVNSMIDVSDGLLADLGHIVEMSRKGAVIYEKDIPISKDAKDFDSAVREGEDFELIFTVSAQDAGKLIEKWPFKTRLSKIGYICMDYKGLWLDRGGNKRQRLEPTGFTHF
jgi:thiamine-monophosphate kinase